MRLFVEAMNTELVATRFERMGAAGISAKPALEEVADIMMETIDAIFKSQGRRGGGSWKRLTAGWLARKQRQGLDPRIGYAKGALVRSLTERGDRNQTLKITRQYVRLDTKLPYAFRQNVERPFTKFLQGDRERMRNVIRKYLIDQWKHGAGFWRPNA